MNKKLSVILLLPLIIFIIDSCGTSTGSRYPQEQGIRVKNQETDTSKYRENFDLSKYHAKINVKEKNKPADSASNNVWYTYNNAGNTSDTSQSILKTAPGYRVLILTTDNLDDANNARSEVYFKSSQKAIYVVFDPPFYKVEAGDFTEMDDAKNLSFKLKQLGYPDVKVINETINIYK